MAPGQEELSRRAHDTAGAHRRAEEALRAHADTARGVARAFDELAAVERREADGDPDPHGAATRRFQADLCEQHAETTREEAETMIREADTERSHAGAAEARSVAARSSDVFER
jgi:hypothetical protein